MVPLGSRYQPLLICPEPDAPGAYATFSRERVLYSSGLRHGKKDICVRDLPTDQQRVLHMALLEVDSKSCAEGKPHRQRSGQRPRSSRLTTFAGGTCAFGGATAFNRDRTEGALRPGGDVQIGAATVRPVERRGASQAIGARQCTHPRSRAASALRCPGDTPTSPGRRPGRAARRRSRPGSRPRPTPVLRAPSR